MVPYLVSKTRPGSIVSTAFWQYPVMPGKWPHWLDPLQLNEGPAIRLWPKGVGVAVSTLSSGSAGIKADANVARNGRETIRNFIVMYLKGAFGVRRVALDGLEIKVTRGCLGVFLYKSHLLAFASTVTELRG